MREVIEAALAESGGRVSGPGGAATKLGRPRPTLEGENQAIGNQQISVQRSTVELIPASRQSQRIWSLNSICSKPSIAGASKFHSFSYL